MAAPMAAAGGRRQARGMADSLHIVCGIDGSPGAREGARTAAKLSQGLGLPLQLVHVVRVRAPGHLNAYTAHASEREQLREGARCLREIACEFGLRAEHRLEVGNPAERLGQIAEDERAAMLVVGSRGRGALRAAVLGSVSRELAARASCPVIVVPPRLSEYSRGRQP